MTLTFSELSFLLLLPGAGVHDGMQGSMTLWQPIHVALQGLQSGDRTWRDYQFQGQQATNDSRDHRL